MNGDRPDVLVVGGGVLGLAVARELRSRHSGASVVLLEKEPELGRHQSGRNSGVLHAGFYYATDSMKAELTREGNRRLTAFCRRRDLPINECGKLVVARDESEHRGLEELARRGRANGVELEMVSEEEARRIEPRARTAGRALWSPATATVDPEAVVRELAREAERIGVEIRRGVAYRGLGDGGPGPDRGGDPRSGRGGARAPDASPESRPVVRTDDGVLRPGHVVNCAGLYADRVARDFGFARRFRILPFKGLYLHSDEPPGSYRTNIYPVPRIDRPFLGVHFTVGVDGGAKIGPTATPAFWREHYRGLENFDAGEMWEILRREAGHFLWDDFGFRTLAAEELAKHRRSTMARLASELARGVRAEDFRRWGEPGVRAQLVDVEERELVMDFLLQGDARSTHVLNAVSPGFTCALPFAEEVADRVESAGSGTGGEGRGAGHGRAGRD